VLNNGNLTQIYGTSSSNVTTISFVPDSPQSIGIYQGYVIINLFNNGVQTFNVYDVNMSLIQ
jgi:hypothetical protein